jgi:SNF2 family DNA or RNA helicase
LKTARRVLGEMGCRALIADEVGLGKTIEAGLIIKELIQTGQAKKILILAPATLLHQWGTELFQKFGLNFVVAKKGTWPWYCDLVVASLDKAKRGEHRELILANQYDLVVVDEAHKLKNRQTENWSLISEINTRGLVLLTATPLQNKVEEVYNLVCLLRPDLFRDYNSFLAHYQLNPRALISELKDKLNDIMIRNLTREQGVKNVNRQVQLVKIDLLPEEKFLYRAIRSYGGGFLWLTLAKEFCSSIPALYVTLEKKNDYLMLERLENVNLSNKLWYLEQIVRHHPGKILVFTEYIQTQFYIAGKLKEMGVKHLYFNGMLNRNQKEFIKWLFEKKDYRVMICTDSGSQGLNLQFCDVIVNYDLPWNPMKVEQRIGRIDRLGQTASEVYVYNFILRETIEEKIFKVLSEKITLFKECIGELDSILVDDSEKEELTEVLEKM